MRDLGPHRLRDMGAPDRLGSSSAPDLVPTFRHFGLHVGCAAKPADAADSLRWSMRELAEICELIREIVWSP